MKNTSDHYFAQQSEDECAKDISLKGTNGAVKDNESPVASPQRDKGHAVTAELGTDLEVHEEHHKKDTEDSEHISVVLKEEKLEILQVLLRTELSPLTSPVSCPSFFLLIVHLMVVCLS